MDIREKETESGFQKLSRSVTELVRRGGEVLLSPDAASASELVSECVAVSAQARQREENSHLLVGISAPEDRITCAREAQRCNRLGRMAHQVMVLAQNIQDIAGEPGAGDAAAFEPLYRMAESELRDAVLSVLRGDEQLARGVQQQDERLDALYAAETKRIFAKASETAGYDFRVGVGLLFILRAIERIGDHAKQLALPIGDMLFTK